MNGKQLDYVRESVENEGYSCSISGQEGAGRMRHVWRIRKWHPERYGERCTVLAYGRLNSAMVRFDDGVTLITSRYYVRKANP